VPTAEQRTELLAEISFEHQEFGFRNGNTLVHRKFRRPAGFLIEVSLSSRRPADEMALLLSAQRP
jgi:hypothetical protein